MWEGPFLLIESNHRPFTACMAYVDLNPIRAKKANTPGSNHTSVQNRLTCAAEGKQPKQLLRFAGMPRQIMSKWLPFESKSYIELVELTKYIIMY